MQAWCVGVYCRPVLLLSAGTYPLVVCVALARCRAHLTVTAEHGHVMQLPDIAAVGV